MMKMKKKMMSVVLGIMLVASLCLQACGSNTEETPKSTPTPSVSVDEPATATPAPTEEPVATATPASTEAPAATATPVPTEEPTATATPVPTEAPAATATPAPTEEPAATATPVPTKAPAAPSELTVDLSGRLSVWGQGTGTENADGSVTFAGGTVDKCSFPLPVTLKAGDKIDVVATLKFDAPEDVAVRFYLTDDSFNNCTVDIVSVPNSGAEATEAKFTLEAAQDVNAILFAASAYGVQIQNVTLCSIKVSGDSVTASSTPSVEDSGDWLSVWATTEEKCNLSGPTDSAMPKKALEGTTIRQIIRVTAGGSQIRFKLSNQYGESDVEVKSMHVAKQSKDALSDGKGYGTAKVHMSTIDTATDTAVTVNGQSSFVIPKGKVIVTDPIDLAVEGLDNIAVSMFFGSAPKSNITGHRGARATTYQIDGDKVSAESMAAAQTTTAWYFLADCATVCPEGKAVVFFGDSITDGYGTDASYLGKKPDSYTRYIDYLAKRLQANDSTKNISVLNEGLGSNSILGMYPTVSGKQRFSRDVLEHDKVEYVVILFGVNDIGKTTDASLHNKLIPEYEKMIKLCHDNGIKVYGAPILPFGTSDYYTAAAETVRTEINNWMRSDASELDGIIAFDEAVADPANPINIKYEYTKADGLHPYEGYSVMADAVELSMFTE